MTVTVDDLAQHLGFTATPVDTEALQRVLDTATATITPHLLPNDAPTPEQGQVLDNSVLKVAAAHWRSKDAPGGLYLMGDGADTGTYLPRDALSTAWDDLCNANLAAPTAFA